MNTKQFQYVLSLARDGSFSQAAENLNISQPSLSQYIKKIEQELGVTLFDRTGNKIRLTDAGEIYLEAGKKILDLEHQMENRFSELLSFKTGRIIVGISPHRSVWMMPEAIVKFRKKYPGMYVVFEEKIGQDLMNGAENGEFDLCVTTLPVNKKLFSYEHIMREEIVLAISAESTLLPIIEQIAVPNSESAYPQVDVKCFDGADFVVLGESQLMQHSLEELCHNEGITFKKAVECRSIEAQIAMVKAGIGIALVPSSMAKFSSDPTIRYFSLKQKMMHREVVVLYRKGQYLSEAVEAFKNILTTL